jgi:glycosyltransferase involved in cell wall biosynthesis
MGSNMRPAVCIVHQYYYPEHPHVRRDAEALVQAGYDVSVVALRHAGESPREVLNGVEIHRVPLEHHRGGVARYFWEYFAFLMLAFWTVSLLHLRMRLQIVEVDNMPDFLVFCALVPKLFGAQVIFYIFDNMPELWVVTRRCSPRHPVVRFLVAMERLAAAFADHVIVTQQPAYALALARGVPERKVSIVLNGPDLQVFEPQEPQPRDRQDGAFKIITHGAILERFGIQVLVDALPAIAAEAPGVELQILGDGEYRPQLEELVRNRGLSDRVTFRDWVPHREVPQIIGDADVGYVGMLCDLMLSNKLMEYVVRGVPVALAELPTYEHYYPANTVTYFTPGDAQDTARALLQIYHNPDDARLRAQRAFTLYQEHYSWTIQRGIYVDIYARLLQRLENQGAVPTPESSMSV